MMATSCSITTATPYRHTLEALGNQKGLLGLIFNKSQNKFDSDHPWSSAFGRASRAQF